MKNTIRLWILPFLVLAFLNLRCSDKEGGEIIVKVTPDESFVVPLPMATCNEIVQGSSSKSYTASSVKFRELSLEWSENFQVEIILITLRFRSGALKGGEKKLDIAGDELDALLNHGTQTTVFPTAGIYTSNPLCGLRGGGLSFVANSGDASVSVIVDVVGVATDASGESFPVYGSGVAFAKYLAPR
jgi:hypothetical protein